MNNNVLAIKKSLIRFKIKEIVIILAGSVILPFLVHLIPVYKSIPMGARILPMFYTPLIGIILFKPHVGVICAMLAPYLNFLFTGHPAGEKVGLLTFELLLYSGIIYEISSRCKKTALVAPVAFLSAKFASLILAVFILRNTASLQALNSLVDTIIISSPGVLILFLLNSFLLRAKKNNTLCQ